MSEEFTRWLDNAEFITEPTQEQIAFAREVLSAEGMRVIWGMQLAAAQGYRVQLENTPLGTPERDAAASLLQGSIKGIYTLRDTLIELVEMGKRPAAPEQETE